MFIFDAFDRLRAILIVGPLPENECARCGNNYHLLAGDDPTIFCHTCAHHVAENELLGVLNELTALRAELTKCHETRTTPRYVNDDDRERVKEVKIHCSRGCRDWFVVRPDKDRKERTENLTLIGFYVCPCGTERVVSIGGS